MVKGASSLAKNFKISNLAIGLTIVAFGTSTPELVVSLISSFTGKNDAAFGNILGSNNFNILFILGATGMIYPLVVQKSTIKFEIPLTLFASILLFVLVKDSFWSNGSESVLSRLDGFLLLTGFSLFMLYIYKTMKDGVDKEDESIKIFPLSTSLGLIVLGLFMLIGGGKLTVDQAVLIAKEMGLSERFIGLTILAIGTSLPELVTSVVAAYRKNTDIAIGNVLGSNIFNILFIMGVSSLIKPIPYNTSMDFDQYVVMGSSIALLIFMFTINTRKLDRWEALLLFLGYITYLLYLIGTIFYAPSKEI